MPWTSSARLVALSAIALLPLAAGCGGSDGDLQPTTYYAVASGDVDNTSVTLWAEAVASGPVYFDVFLDEKGGAPVAHAETAGCACSIPVKVRITGLAPGTRYRYEVHSADVLLPIGFFRTTQPVGVRTGLRIGVAADFRGDMAPFPALRGAELMDLDAFVDLGDTVYADFPNEARSLIEFRLRNAQIYAPSHGYAFISALRASTATFASVSDHEVVDDFAGGAPTDSDPRFADDPAELINDSVLFETGYQAFLEYNPIVRETYEGTGDPSVDGEIKLYRYRTFGSDAAIFVLDQRSFRVQEVTKADSTNAADVDRFQHDAFAPDRPMLADAQLDLLERDLLAAQQAGVTWKLVMLPEPIQNLGSVNGQDRYEGYAWERSRLLGYIHDNGIQNVAFVTADIHGMIVNNLQYQPNGADDPQVDVEGAFEIAIPAIGYDPPLGLNAVQEVARTPLDLEAYKLMSMDEQDALFQGYLDDLLVDEGYDTVGLDGSTVAATLLEGRWLRVNAFGWTELDVDPVTAVLTVTTWGIHPYTSGEAEDGLEEDPFVLSRFTVTPVGFTPPP